ncbi:MAG: alpha/beta fold hydrolase [Gordonia sp. (in: high G+C Gram-positive bacteria)]
MPFFDGPNGHVYYRYWRTAEQPFASLVFLHGYGEHSGLYHRFAEQLNAQGINVWALDQYGHGLSDGPRGTLDSMDDAIGAARVLTDHLATGQAPDVPVVIAGHSLGSIVATLTAISADSEKYAGLVVSGAALSPVAWLAAVEDEGVELDLDALSAAPFYRDELANDPLAFTGGDLGELARRLFPPAWEQIERGLPELSLPILAVHGSNDQIAPIASILDWRDRTPPLRVEVFEDSAHDVLNEVAHREVVSAVADFVASTVPQQVPA